MTEKIRTQKGMKGSMGDKFSLRQFKSLPDHRTMLAYASRFLEKLGTGSSRATFLFSGKYALKIALNDKGFSQNESELDVYTNSKNANIIAKVYGADEENRWIISDLVKELNDPDEFAQLSGTDWDDFTHTVYDWLGKKATKTTKPDGFTQNVIKFARENNLLAGDIEEINHWGKTPDGRVVLLDYGLTSDVWDKHYKPNQMPQAKSAPSDAKTSAQGKTSDQGKPQSIDPHGKTAHDIGHDKTMAAPGAQDAKTVKAKKNPVLPSSSPQQKTNGDTKKVPYKPDDDEKTRR